MKTLRFVAGRREQSGAAAVIVIMAVVLLSIMSGVMLMSSLRGSGERNASIDQNRALLVADSGIAHAVANLSAGVEDDIGSPNNPVAFGGGMYFVDIELNPDLETYTVRSYSRAQAEQEALEAMISPDSQGIYTNALFAGNSSGDPLYSLDLGGEGGQKDEIYGDVYSGRDVTFEDDAFATGTVRAQGLITGTSGESGVSQPIPDIEGMDYANSADFAVADLFVDAQYRRDNAGGRAWQVKESNPAHIFRRNPSDRSSETSSTVKDDYFMEDPYEAVGVDPSQNGSDPYEISLSGVSGEPGPDGNQKVYYIDGNLWLHNLKSYSFEIEHDEPNGIQVTFVVEGNIYFSDNLFLDNEDTDGVAFIAIKDESVQDSGNVYFGDPEFGTLKVMNSFMYAENNFHDVNLDASGSASVKVNGNMTAGNQVQIQRDYGGEHTKLTVDFDNRIATGELEMPGLPGQSGAGGGALSVTHWRHIAHFQP